MGPFCHSFLFKPFLVPFQAFLGRCNGKQNSQKDIRDNQIIFLDLLTPKLSLDPTFDLERGKKIDQERCLCGVIIKKGRLDNKLSYISNNSFSFFRLSIIFDYCFWRGKNLEKLKNNYEQLVRFSFTIY